MITVERIYDIKSEVHKVSTALRYNIAYFKLSNMPTAEIEKELTWAIDNIFIPYWKLIGILGKTYKQLYLYTIKLRHYLINSLH